MLASIRYNLANLTNPHGRDARQTFWYWVLFLYILQYGLAMLAMIPMLGSIFDTAFSAAMSGAGKAEIEARMTQALAGPMRIVMIASLIFAFVFWMLLLCSFIRRLHDSGKPAWIAGIALGLQFASQALSLTMLDDMLTFSMATQLGEYDRLFDGAMGPMIGVTALSWTAMGVLIGFGVLRSQEGPNRFGAEPVRF